MGTLTKQTKTILKNAERAETRWAGAHRGTRTKMIERVADAQWISES